MLSYNLIDVFIAIMYIYSSIPNFQPIGKWLNKTMKLSIKNEGLATLSPKYHGFTEFLLFTDDGNQ